MTPPARRTALALALVLAACGDPAARPPEVARADEPRDAAPEPEPAPMPAAREIHVPRPDLVLRARLFGDGPPVLLLSGGPGGPSEELRPLAERVAATHTAVLLDQRGTGASRLETLDAGTMNMAACVADVEALRAHLGYERWTLLGHSAGGGLALAVAAAHPERVAALVLVASAGPNLDFVARAPAGQRHTDEDRAAMERWMDPARAAAEPERAARELYLAWVRGVVHERAHAERVLAHFRPEPDTFAIAGLMMEDLQARAWDVTDALRACAGPVLVVQGREGFMGADTARQIAACFDDARLELLDGCGHYPMYERPERFLELVLPFLARHAR